MKKRSNFYIVTHKPIKWELPFAHRVIGVEHFDPGIESGISASNVISRSLDSETAFGALRSLMPMNQDLDGVHDETPIFCGSYRLFLGKEMNRDWLSPILQENKILKPIEIKSDWSNIIATEMPDDIDILIPAPRLLPDSVIGQFSRLHHLDDLLLAVGCAIRSGLLDTLSIPKMLSSNTLIPYGNFAAKKSIRYEFNKRLWNCALDFHKNFYTPRIGYQRRVIDFAFERVISMAIVQMIIKNNLQCASCRNIWVSDDGVYTPSL
jgi:hypothetical protein